MTFLSASDDLELRTLASLPSAFARLAYLEALYQKDSGFRHWGMERTHGSQNSANAIRAAYCKLVAELVSRDLPGLWADWAQERDNQDGQRANIQTIARGELPSLRSAHLSLVFETVAALEAARQQRLTA